MLWVTIWADRHLRNKNMQEKMKDVNFQKQNDHLSWFLPREKEISFQI